MTDAYGWSEELKCHWSRWEVAGPQSLAVYVEGWPDFDGLVRTATTLMADVTFVEVWTDEESPQPRQKLSRHRDIWTLRTEGVTEGRIKV